MINAKKIVGKIEGLKCEYSVIQPFKNIGKRVATTALLGVLTESTSLLSAAPILILASKGRRAKNFTFKIDGIDVIGQFTTVKFNEGDQVVIIISEEQDKGVYLAYAVLIPNKGILHMLYDSGRSFKKHCLHLLKWAIVLSIFSCIFFTIIALVGYSNADNEKDIVDFKNQLIISYLVSFIFSFGLLFSFLIGKDNVGFLGRYSEKIFEILEFEQPKNQNLFNSYLIDEEGLHVSVLDYRKSLIGKDSYPKDYFDNENDKN
ncbi:MULTISPECIES: putative type VI secretion system effector [unclassified Acinetobacter]|uniref:putative type VI secretion system effector n=1 Tax=unclassified Acinetobacter TaxID=196816 RepID=UPI0015D3925F|nr:MULTISPECIES: putative type VI secretion system effector [unclassified Acinetobacter]